MNQLNVVTQEMCNKICIFVNLQGCKICNSVLKYQLFLFTFIHLLFLIALATIFTIDHMELSVRYLLA